jgi:hypothetical protein
MPGATALTRKLRKDHADKGALVRASIAFD